MCVYLNVLYCFTIEFVYCFPCVSEAIRTTDDGSVRSLLDEFNKELSVSYVIDCLCIYVANLA